LSNTVFEEIAALNDLETCMLNVRVV
jgi:hypothetical protein